MKIGDIVRLKNETAKDLKDLNSRPRWGGIYGKVAGTVCAIEAEQLNVRECATVIWDNGQSCRVYTSQLVELTKMERIRRILAKSSKHAFKYEKLLLLIALIVIIDHCFLNNRITNKIIRKRKEQQDSHAFRGNKMIL
ncbi:hypothetical protein KJ632_00820 [Patescibacteria group bacterium]|nr:hypothetical protein [Patescibacteria group bacterium]